MERLIMQDLREWKTRPDRKPLLLQGARQTGKTWALQELGRQDFETAVTVDFLLDQSARSLFERDLDPHRIIRAIEVRCGQRIEPGRTLLVLDEVQEAPRGITALKYFCEQAPEYHVAAAGSYMGIELRRRRESFPVGKVDRLTLRPLCFQEFVRAVAGAPAAEALAEADMDLLADQSALFEGLLREYLAVGGMPQVVASYAALRNLVAARRLQLQIASDYSADFSTHAPTNLLERVRMVWESLPSQLARENKKFLYGAVRSGGRGRDFETCIQWLEDYGAARRVRRARALRLPLNGYEDPAAFKLFSVDVGLLGAMAGLDMRAVTEGSTLFTEFKGALTEQYVLQELVCAGLSPYYWSADSGTAEVDFAVECDGEVLPIEVKAGENLRSKSLRSAHDRFGLERCVRTSLSGYRDDGWLVNIPLWAIGSLQRLTGAQPV